MGIKYGSPEAIDLCDMIGHASNAAIAQGIFLEYGITDDDDAKATRNGGFGSTDKNE